ncbi:VOC family protein [Listeria aquatica]|uniref:VOC family protein n=1 Tax=Listeria aquatica TaxID=1494960 RepID=UPI003F72AB24
MIQGIHHISAFIKDFETTHHFYQDILGYRLVKNTINQTNLKMRHLFYGDYAGTPGTVLTFFEIPRIGHTYEGAHYFGRVSLGVPAGSLAFWERRLDRYGYLFKRDKTGILLDDPDGMKLRLMEISEVISAKLATRHSDIRQEEQIIRIVQVEICTNVPLETEKWLREIGFQGEAGHLSDDMAGSFTQIIPNVLAEKTRFGRGAIDHIAYALRSKEEVDRLHASAMRKGFVVEELADRGYFKSLYLRDPGFGRIEFASLEPGFTLDEKLDELGSTLSLPPFLEAKRAEIESYFGGI